jgi:hypothetical protein
MGTQYSHLTLEERYRLRGFMEMGLSKAEIARRLGRHRLTIYREFGRNRNAAGYRPDGAGRLAWARKLIALPGVRPDADLLRDEGDHRQRSAGLLSGPAA